MQLEKLNSVYFIGIGGIGMSAIARYFKAHGKVVSGYDKTPTALTDALEAEGIVVHFEDTIEAIPFQVKKEEKETILIVITPAVPAQHIGLNYFRSKGYTIKKRSEVLGLLTQQSFTIAVAGTHGKTTTSSMIAHILCASGRECTAFLGGIAKNYNSNLLLPKNKDGINTIVVEADEYDRSFLTLFPNLAVITSMDADHLDIYGDKSFLEDSFRLFGNQVKKEGTLIVKQGLPLHNNKALTYSTEVASQYTASNIRVEQLYYKFDLEAPGLSMKDIQLGLPGKHNVENAVAAVAVGLLMDVAPEKIKTALASFTGVKRRFEYHIRTKDLVYIDDYAHHPEELKACINSVKEMYPGKKITGVFQPHLFSRTRDFADGFSESLSLLDEVILMEIYPARELPMEGVTSAMLLDKISSKSKVVCQKENLLEKLEENNIEVLLTLGAGDIDQWVDPIRNLLNKKIC